MTVGTGLSSSKPLDMAIIKDRKNSSNYQVGHSGSDFFYDFSFHYLLNSNTGISNSSPLMGRQSSHAGNLLQLGSAGFSSSLKYTAWLFQAVDGFSSFCKYTGNGSDNGPFVYTGFRPAFLVIKRSTAGLTGEYVLQDAGRDPYNPVNKKLLVNWIGRENSYSGYDPSVSIDFLSNGFKIRGGNDPFINGNNDSYIIMAFSEMPFKYANAR